MSELTPLTTTSGRPLHYGNAYLTHDTARLEQRTPSLAAVERLLDWDEVEHGLQVTALRFAALAA